MRLLTSSAATVAAILLAASACKKAPPAEEQLPPPPPPGPVAVTALDLGKAVGPDKRVAAPMSSFGTRDTIYASVGTSGTSTGATLTALWTYQAAKTVTVDSTTLTIAPSGPAVTEFHILNTSAWPVGKFKVAILLNGAPAMEKNFEIKQ